MTMSNRGRDTVRKKKCYIYTQVSTAAQVEGYSLEAQQERLRDYADYKNLEIAGEYCDAGKYGKSMSEDLLSFRCRMIYAVRRTRFLLCWYSSCPGSDGMRQTY